MRKLLVALALFIIFFAAAAFIYLRFFRKPPKTIVGWRARVTTLRSRGAPSLRSPAEDEVGIFADPFGIAVGPDGSIYIADAGEKNSIKKLTNKGELTTLAGGGVATAPTRAEIVSGSKRGWAEGFQDGAGANALFNTPSGLAIDDKGNLYVADTSNNRIRKVTPQGVVTTIAGVDNPGDREGRRPAAELNGPIGVAVDRSGNVYVADTYNAQIKKVATDGQVTLVAGSVHGDVDGPAKDAAFDTPCGVAITADGSLIVADTGNNLLRKISVDGQVTTLPVIFSADSNHGELTKPIGLAVTHDGFIYVTELDRAQVIQVAPDGSARVIAGGGPGYADGVDQARFNQLTGITIDKNGDLYVCDSGNYLIRKLTPADKAADKAAPKQGEAQPALRTENKLVGLANLPWPLSPQNRPHEVVATMGEVRGSFDSTDSRDHLHSGLDVFGAYGDVVRAVYPEKVVSPLPNWGFASLNEGMRIGIFSYIHMQVGRDVNGKPFADSRFALRKNADGNPIYVRVKRGASFNIGDALGTINRMYHVHMNVGSPGSEINPLALSPIGFSDHVAPQIEKDGIQLFDETGKRLAEKQKDRLLVSGRVRIVVDAFDRTDLNAERRRLGLYRLGYQVLKPDGTPAAGFTEPRINMIFDRLAADHDATKIIYGEESGITVYGSKTTRFLYEVTNTLRDGKASRGVWDTSELPKGDYTLRIIAADYSGNEATAGRDLMITVR